MKRALRAGSVAAVLSLAAGLLTLAPASAQADATADFQAAVLAGDAKHAGENLQPRPADVAIAEAKRTGKDVPIPALTDEYSTSVATPAGKIRRDQNLEAQRTRRADGSWAALDDTLVRGADGSLSPVAASEKLVISGGGTGPLATMTTKDGKQLAVGSPFPGALPAPVVSGNSALFTSVAPDVDLKVTATKFGGYTTVLVLHTPAAAANPAVRALSFPTVSKGLELSSAADGDLRATSGGEIVFTAPTPKMWSAAAPAATSGSVAAMSLNSVAGTRSAPASDALGTGQQTPDVPSSTDGPGSTATVADVPASASADAKGVGVIRLSPSPELLDGANTSYPIYVDPVWSNDARGKSHHAWVMQAHTTAGNFDRTGSLPRDHPGVGYNGWESPYGIERSLYEFNLNGYLSTTVINYANLHISQTSSSDFSCTTGYPLSLYRAAAFTDTVNWNNYTTYEYVDGKSSVPGNGQSGCPGELGIDFNVTAPMRNALANTGTPLAFALVGKEGTGDRNALKRFSYTAILSTEYDHVPLTPTDPQALPSPQRVTAPNTDACWNAPLSEYGWVTGTGTTLTSVVSSYNQAQLTEFVNIWDNALAGAPSVSNGWSGFVPSGSRASYTVPQGTLKDGHNYGWQTQGDDGILRGPGGPVCHFAVDTTPPIAAFGTFTDPSTQFPPAGNGQTTNLRLGDTGHIPFTASDPNPSGLLASGLACVRWSYDPQMATHEQVCGSNGTPLNVTEITTKPTHWGTNILYAQVYDNAGNISQTLSYAFYVPWAPGPVAFGDTTGDARPDILVPDTAGNLVTHGRATDPGNTNVPPTGTAAPAAQAPEGKTWNAFHITHRGSRDPGNNADDLFVHRDSGDELHYYPNNKADPGHFPLGAATTLDRPNCTGTAAACTGYHQDSTWEYTSQITPIGSTSTTRTPSGKFTDATGILTVESGSLWYYPPKNAVSLRAPVLVATGGWDNRDLMVPGNTLNIGTDTAPALWARDRSTGSVFQYALTTAARSDALGDFTVVTAVTTSPATPIGSGFTTTAFPTVGADGDQTDDGVPDLWALDATGNLHVWPGVATNKAVTGLTNDHYRGDTRAPTAQWKLNDTANSTSAASNPTTYNATNTNVTFGNDTVDGRSTNVATFNSSDSALATTGPVVDTRKSFTISTWAKSTTAGGIIASQNLTHASSFILWSEGTGGGKAWRFALATADDDSWPYDFTNTTNSSALVQVGKWTQLTASYNATTGQMSLYVDGTLAGSNYHNATTSPAPSGKFVMGRYQYPDPLMVSFKGSISNLAVYDGASATTASTTVIRHAASNNCLDIPGNDTAQGVWLYTCNNSPAQQFTLNPANGTISAGGKCLDITGGGTANGTGISLWTCTPGAWNQTWLPRPDGSLYNPGSKRCLDLPGNNTTAGTRLTIYDCNTTPAQTWSIPTINTPALPTNP
ncbi:ricin-type beta-trefoil lectin domain protein [Kitasatospora sp. CMC57]|uniref:ricin-type beta-trefoil lectin domain protein n=1 Tax=Kitasatospora sp. CMC57 TaxID=3231513 RepID=UPI0038B4B956